MHSATTLSLVFLVILWGVILQSGFRLEFDLTDLTFIIKSVWKMDIFNMIPDILSVIGTLLAYTTHELHPIVAIGIFCDIGKQVSWIKFKTWKNN